jgi:PhoD-like phosphatase
VVLTGDIHSFSVNDLRLPGRDPDAPVVATELVGTSITSGGSSRKGSGFRKHPADNPHIRFLESRLRGYTRCAVIRQRWYADLRVVDTIERPGAGVRTLASFVVEDGRPRAERRREPAGNIARMDGVDNHIRGCLGSTVTDRSRGSEPEFAGLRTKPRKPQAPSLATRSPPKFA